MVSINQDKETCIDFSELDFFYKKISHLSSPTGVYDSKRITIEEDTDEIIYGKYISDKFKNLNSLIFDLNFSNNRSIKDISNLTKLSLECIVLIVFYLKSLGVPVTSCWDEMVKEFVSKKIKNGGIKNLFTSDSEYNANIEGALLVAIEERKELLKYAGEVSDQLNGI